MTATEAVTATGAGPPLVLTPLQVQVQVLTLTLVQVLVLWPQLNPDVPWLYATDTGLSGC